MTKYGYTQSADRKTLQILDPQRRVLANIAIADNREQASKDAQLIMLALNAYHHGDIRKMTTEQLKECIKERYSSHMYYEAAERGYDFRASQEAMRELCDAERELKRRLVAEEQQGEGNAAEQAEVLERAAE